mgnify:CR=1 FL=1
MSVYDSVWRYPSDGAGPFIIVTGFTGGYGGDKGFAIALCKSF